MSFATHSEEPMPNNSTVRAFAISSTHCSSSSSKSSRWVSSRLWMFLWVTFSTISCKLSCGVISFSRWLPFSPRVASSSVRAWRSSL